MKVSDLKIDEEIEINGHKYKYQGVKKIRMAGIGTVQKIVFEANLGEGRTFTANTNFKLRQFLTI